MPTESNKNYVAEQIDRIQKLDSVVLVNEFEEFVRKGATVGRVKWLKMEIMKRLGVDCDKLLKDKKSEVLHILERK